MQFVVIGLDGIDSEAATRRQTARPDHIALGDRLAAAKHLWYGAALLNADGSMKGSLYVVDFPSENALQAWLDQEPYVVGKVWEEITIHRSNTRDPWQYSHDKDWFAKT